MKNLNTFIAATFAASLLLPAAALNAAPHQAEPGGAKTEDASTSVKKAVPAPQQMNDSKDVSVSEKKSGVDSDVKPKATPKKRSVRPHSHPQDGKGMYVPEKK